MTDAEARRCGYRTGLDTLVVRTVNDGHPLCGLYWLRGQAKALSVPPGAHAAFVLIRMLLLQTCRAEFIISGHRSYAPITGKEVISQASLQSHLLFLFTKPAKSGRDHLYKFLSPCFKQRKPHALQKLLMSIRKWRFLDNRSNPKLYSQKCASKTSLFQRISSKKYNAMNIKIQRMNKNKL